MAWDNQGPPWGPYRGPSSPEELIAKLINKLKEHFREAGSAGGSGHGETPSPGLAAGRGRELPSAKTLLMLLAGLLLLGLLYASFYTIAPGERGVILRFGKVRASTAAPGLNLKVPLADEVRKVDIERVRKEEFGFRTKVPGVQTVYEKEGFEGESLMLTADKNVINAEWIVQYKVRDPIAFLFKVEDVRQSVRDASETAIRRIVGNMNFDYVLGNRDILAAATARELQATLDSYESGVSIVTVQLQDVNPPNEVKPAFNEVNEADQDMKRLVNEAEEAYNRVIPKARGQAKETLEAARGYAVERVNEAKGESFRFTAILKEYAAAKEVTRKRLYLETMQEVLPQVTDIYVIDKEQRGIVPFLNLSQAVRSKE